MLVSAWRRGAAAAAAAAAVAAAAAQRSGVARTHAAVSGAVSAAHACRHTSSTSAVVRKSERQTVTPAAVRVFVAERHDPFFNLATEEWMLQHLDPSTQTLFLWRNEPTVVIGRNQNPWKECHVQRLAEDGVHLVRRSSGGGAVYQDLGNTCFTFLSHRNDYSTARNFGVLLRGLRTLGIDGEQTGRNDMVVQERKFSGSAFKYARDAFLHHGTLLLDVDMNALSRYLNPNKAKLASKGVASVRARVVNLRELVPTLSHERVCDAVIESFFEEYGRRCTVETLSHDALTRIPELNQHYDQLRDWHWRFGETPSFKHELETRFDWGTVDLHVDSRDGVITNCVMFTDSLQTDIVDAVTSSLIGAKYDPESVGDALASASTLLGDSPSSKHVLDMAAWLRDAM